MSKKEKLLNKLFATPPPKGFAWHDLITVMSQAEFSSHCESGSHYMFEHSSGFRLGISKTHPSGILKIYQVKAAKEALISVGAAQGEKNGKK